MVVNGYSEQWLRKGFPWVYPKEVVTRPARVKPGQSVALRSQGGHDLGMGLWDEGWIAVRRFRPDAGSLPIEEALERALALREQVVDPGTTAYRLVNAENDGLPGIRVDRWGWHMVLTLDSPSLMPLVEATCDWLEQRLQPRGIHLAWRIDDLALHRDVLPCGFRTGPGLDDVGAELTAGLYQKGARAHRWVADLE